MTTPGRPRLATRLHRILGGALLPAALLALAAPPAMAQEAFSIADVLSAPMPSGLVAGPEGRRIAWVQDDRGARNVWVARAPDFRGRPATSWSEDDGRGVGDLAFTADGTTVVFVRGGAPNRQDEHPNPTSDPEGAERALWAVPFEGGEPRRLAEGRSPVPAPDGSTVAFLQGSDIWTVDAGGQEEARIWERSATPKPTCAPETFPRKRATWARRAGSAPS